MADLAEAPQARSRAGQGLTLPGAKGEPSLEVRELDTGGFGAFRDGKLIGGGQTERDARRVGLPEGQEGSGGEVVPIQGPASTIEPDEDLGPRYMNARGKVGAQGAAQELLRRFGGEKKPVAVPPAVVPEEKDKGDILDTAGEVAKDLGKGIVETPRALLSGARDAVQETMETIDSLAIWLNENVADLSIPGVDPKLKFDLPEIDDPESKSGGLVKGVTQFLVGFLGGGKVLRAVKPATGPGKIAKGAAQGSIADATVFDPHEERLSNLVQEFPALQNPINEFLAASPDDTEAEGRFKASLEGIVPGALIDGLMIGVRTLRSARQLKETNDTAKAAETELAEEGAEELTQRDFMLLGDPAKPLFRAGTEEQAAGFLKIDANGKAANINLARLDTPESVKEAISKTAKLFDGEIDEARRGTIRNSETSKLASELGVTVEQLLARRKGEAFNAEQALAARRILASSGKQLVELAKKASSTDSTERDLLAFRKALSLHAGIQQQVSGLTAEAGRALQAFRIEAQGRASLDRNIRDALEASGGADFSRAMADKLAMADQLSPEQLNKVTRGALLARTGDAFLEVWINGLLSGPQTQAVNVLSNSLVAMWQIPERFVAAGIGRVTGAGGVAPGEAKALAFGMVKGFREGLALAGKTLVSGEPSDAVTKLDLPQRRAISAEAFDLSGVPGQAVDFMGEVIRVPGRLLLAGDELFKATGYRMELNAQAFRNASAEGLEGDAMAKRMAQIIENPPENIQLAAIDAARYQTFTKELGTPGRNFQKTVNSFPALRLITPFIRTPVNILKFVGERTPLAPLSANIRAEIAAGGARRQLAMARMAVGSMTMAGAADLAAQGIITGNGPTDPKMRQIWLNTHQPNSIKVGDEWFAYSRLDPLGSFLGIAADATELMRQTDDADGAELAVAAVVAVSRNVTSKTYLRGMSEFFEFMSNPDRSGRAFAKRFAGTLIPFSTLSSTITRAGIPGVSEGDTVLRDTRDIKAFDEILNQIKSRIPGYSKDLPPRRNVWGAPIVLGGGIGPDIMSPIYTNDVKISATDTELLRLDMPISMPRRTIMGVELKPHEYSRYVELAGNAFKDPGTGLGLKETLDSIISGSHPFSSQYEKATEGPEGGKALIIQRFVQTFRQAAQAEVIEEFEELRDAIEQEAIERQEELQGIR